MDYYMRYAMDTLISHEWTLTPKEAIELQLALREHISLEWCNPPVITVGGVDVRCHKDTARAAITVLSYPSLEMIETSVAEMPVPYPYLPGLLTFREGPCVLAVWEKLKSKPDLLFFDGQGIAHPRGIGLAAHMGLWLGKPSIGVGKSRLYGQHQEPGPLRGNYTDLYHEDDPYLVIGAVVRTRDKVKPVYISPGHMIDISSSVEFVLNCCTRYRLPEPIRHAHRIASNHTIN